MQEEAKLVKIVLSSGQVTHLYSTEESINQVFVQKSFVEFMTSEKDGDLVFIDAEAIKVFEVISDARKKEITESQRAVRESGPDEPAKV